MVPFAVRHDIRSQYSKTILQQVAVSRYAQSVSNQTSVGGLTLPPDAYSVLPNCMLFVVNTLQRLPYLLQRGMSVRRKRHG